MPDRKKKKAEPALPFGKLTECFQQAVAMMPMEAKPSAYTVDPTPNDRAFIETMREVFIIPLKHYLSSKDWHRFEEYLKETLNDEMYDGSYTRLNVHKHNLFFDLLLGDKLSGEKSPAAPSSASSSHRLIRDKMRGDLEEFEKFFDDYLRGNKIKAQALARPGRYELN